MDLVVEAACWHNPTLDGEEWDVIERHSKDFGVVVGLALDLDCRVTLERVETERGTSFEVRVEAVGYEGRARHDHAGRRRNGHYCRSVDECRAMTVCLALLDMYSPTEEEIGAGLVLA